MQLLLSIMHKEAVSCYQMQSGISESLGRYVVALFLEVLGRYLVVVEVIPVLLRAMHGTNLACRNIWKQAQLYGRYPMLLADAQSQACPWLVQVQYRCIISAQKRCE